MEEKIRIAVIVVILFIFAIGAYFTINTLGKEKEYQKKNLYCKMLTTQLNNNITNKSPCVSYYCYYTPEIPSKFYGKAQPLCECDCKTPNGTILHLWVGSSL